MDTALLVCLITSSLSILTFVVTFIFNLSSNKSNNTKDIIVKQRVKTLDNYRCSCKDFLALIKPEVIDDFKKNKEKKMIYTLELSKAKSSLDLILKPFFETEEKINNLTDKIVKLCFLYYSNPNEKSKLEIEELSNELLVLFSLYDWAYWRFIQEQKDGILKDDNGSFDKNYNDVLESVVSLEKKYINLIKK